jgi:Type IV secretion system pilin
MKKFIAKLALFSIVSLILVSIGSISTYATEPAKDSSAEALALSKGLSDLTPATFCIQEILENGKPGPDDGWIITIIEEPLSLEEIPLSSNAAEAKKQDFQSRICYRNYLSFVQKKGGEKVISILASICSEDIKSEKFSGTEYVKYKVATSCRPVQVYLSKGGTSLIVGYISTIYKWAASLVGLIATAVIIISGIQISVAGGDTQAIETAKGRIGKSISGIVILFLSGLILYTINPNFFTQ